MNIEKKNGQKGKGLYNFRHANDGQKARARSYPHIRKHHDDTVYVCVCVYVYVCAFVHARMYVLFVRKDVQANVSSDGSITILLVCMMICMSTRCVCSFASFFLSSNEKTVTLIFVCVYLYVHITRQSRSN